MRDDHVISYPCAPFISELNVLPHLAAGIV
jgi:hypothetical protein